MNVTRWMDEAVRMSMDVWMLMDGCGWVDGVDGWMWMYQCGCMYVWIDAWGYMDECMGG